MRSLLLVKWKALLPSAVLLVMAASTMPVVSAAPVPTTAPATQDELECEPKTTHHEVFNDDGVLIGIFVVKTKRNCLTTTTWVPVGK